MVLQYLRNGRKLIIKKIFYTLHGSKKTKSCKEEDKGNKEKENYKAKKIVDSIESQNLKELLSGVVFCYITGMNRMTARSVITMLNKFKSPQKAASSARFFKTEKGQYGFGDIFIGVTVPEQRKVAKIFQELPLIELETLLESKIHEHRLTALLILTYKPLDKEIYDFYMMHLEFINNWDLVDASAPYIVGQYLFDKNKMILELLSESTKMWERRIAIVATQYFIGKKDFATTFLLAEKLLSDHHDLIHKAVGWMLREVGKRDRAALTKFLNTHAPVMPRTMLRYAIEHYSEAERKAIMGR